MKNARLTPFPIRKSGINKISEMVGSIKFPFEASSLIIRGCRPINMHGKDQSSPCNTLAEGKQQHLAKIDT